MRTMLLCGLFFGCGVAAPAEESALAAPTGAAPRFFVVWAIDADTITFVQIRPGDSDYEKVVRIKDITVHGTDGKVYAKQAWRREMVKGAVVVLSGDDRPVDPAYARLLKAGTLLITIKDSPNVLLYAPYPGTGTSAGKVIFSWKAVGTDLRPGSVALSYAEDLAGPWHLIANRLDNSGEHAWRPPADFPAAVFLRIQAAEKDGTAVRAQTKQRIRFDGGTNPTMK